MRDVEKEQSSSVDVTRKRRLGEEHDRLAQSIRWLWYEFTPYEVVNELQPLTVLVAVTVYVPPWDTVAVLSPVDVAPTEKS